MAKGLEQGGHQFTPHQITGATKQDKVEAHTGPKKRKGDC
jgi:hypothetical protein